MNLYVLFSELGIAEEKLTVACESLHAAGCHVLADQVGALAGAVHVSRRDICGQIQRDLVRPDPSHAVESLAEWTRGDRSSYLHGAGAPRTTKVISERGGSSSICLPSPPLSPSKAAFLREEEPSLVDCPS